MQKLSIIFLCILVLFSSNSLASVTDLLEDRISDDKNINFVIATINKAPKGFYNEQQIQKINWIKYPKSNHFEAELVIEGYPVKLSGKYQESSLIPAFKSYVQKGHVIDYSDLVTVKIPNKKIAPQLIEKNEQIIGKAAKRRLAPNQPISLKDLTAPSIIKKGTNVKMLFDKPGLHIEAQGIALQGGAEGDYIKVRNLDSNKVVKAKIKDESTVSTNG